MTTCTMMNRKNATLAYSGEWCNPLPKLLSAAMSHVKSKNKSEVIRFCSCLCGAIKMTGNKNVDEILENIGELYALVIANVLNENWIESELILKSILNFYMGK